MGYLGNAIVNRLNLHYFIHALATYAGTMFFAVFLLKTGLPAPGVLAVIATILAGRFTIRPHILAVGVRTGLRPLVIAGTICGAGQFPLLAMVHGAGGPLIALIIVSSASDTIYWTCYHAYFASLGDSEHRAQQVGAREAMVAVATVVAPLAGGFGLAHWGAPLSFGLVALVQLASALPLFGAPNVAVRRDLAYGYRDAWRGVQIFMADGWISASLQYVWPMAMFVSLGQDFTAFGGALALASAVGATSGLVLGRHIDAGHGARATGLVCAAQAAITIVCAFATARGEWAILANALRAMVSCLYIPTLMSAMYNQGKEAPCVLRFNTATEGGWDAGCGVGCLCAAGLTAIGASLGHLVLLALPGIGAMQIVLHKYYKEAG